jgi:hypothetical protein
MQFFSGSFNIYLTQGFSILLWLSYPSKYIILKDVYILLCLCLLIMYTCFSHIKNLGYICVFVYLDVYLCLYGTYRHTQTWMVIFTYLYRKRNWETSVSCVQIFLSKGVILNSLHVDVNEQGKYISLQSTEIALLEWAVLYH